MREVRVHNRYSRGHLHREGSATDIPFINEGLIQVILHTFVAYAKERQSLMTLIFLLRRR
jgi:hypothetical protein